MKRIAVSGVSIFIALLAVLLAGGCASQQVKCSQHLVPINIPQGKRAPGSLP